jgi:hypothetical protein
VNDENEKLRDLLWRMREEADEAWRNVDPRSAAHCHAKRDLKLLGAVEELLGPNAWGALEPTKHIAWGDQAICHWTFHPPTRWPATQTYAKITELITRLPCEDETYVEFVARPNSDWNGVTCDACRVRLPSLLRELSIALDDVHEGILEGFRAHPETKRAQELYARDVEPKLTAEQRKRYADQIQLINERAARRAARRSNAAHGKELP